MKTKEILKTLNERYKGYFIFEVEDTGKQIVGFVDDGSFKNIVSVIDTTEEEMNNLINHIDDYSESWNK